MSRDYQHTTIDGTRIKLRDMSDSHLLNTIALHQRRAKEGLVLQYGGISIADDEPWYDEDTIYGQEALDQLGHHFYLAEARHRNLEVRNQ